MSMIGNFALASELDIEGLLRRPAGIGPFLDRLDAGPSGDHLDVDKAWHFLHYALTGEAWEGSFPLNFILLGGTEVGDEDMGYGPARALRPGELRAVSEALAPLSSEELVRRIDPAQMDALEIYPSTGHWAEMLAPDEDDLEYFTGAFDELKRLVTRGAHEGKGLIIWLN